MLDVVIRGGTIVDGTGEPGGPGDLGIQGRRIVALGHVDGPARRTIDAEGQVALRMGDLVPTDRLMWG
jgi:N-acyl-D-amino-acid deacylase